MKQPGTGIRRSIGIAVIAVAVSLGSVACGSTSTSTGADLSDPNASTIPAEAPFNSADLEFVRGMLPHHEQAITMADAVIAKSSYLLVVEFGTTIRATQSSEVEQLRGWLVNWNEPESDPSMSGSMDMPGMNKESFDADMARLGKTAHREYARLWLDLMIEHHRGALAMARTEVDSGKNPDVIALAQTILATQQQEIDAMTALGPLLE
jgi:uncharacterized protein (DUF305 family)